MGPLVSMMYLKVPVTVSPSPLTPYIFVLITSIGLLNITEQNPAKPPEIKSTTTLFLK